MVSEERWWGSDRTGLATSRTLAPRPPPMQPIKVTLEVTEPAVKLSC